MRSHTNSMRARCKRVAAVFGRNWKQTAVSLLIIGLVWHCSEIDEAIAEEQSDQQKIAYELRDLIQVHRGFSLRMHRKPSTPQQFLYGTLSLLHLSSDNQLRRGDRSELIRSLVNFRWPVGKGDSIHEALERLDSRSPGPLWDCLRMDPVGRWRDARERYRELTDRKLPTDWHARRAFWLEYVGLIIESNAAANTASIWRKRIAEDAANANLYRFTYLEVVRRRDRRYSDFELLQPLLDANEIDASERLRRACLVASVTVLDTDADEKRLQTRSTRLVTQYLRDNQFDGGLSRSLMNAFRLYYQSLSKNDRMEVIRTLLRHQRPRITRIILSTTGVSEKDLRQYFLAKQTNLAVHEKPLREVLANLSDQVWLPLWFDDSTINDESLITLDATGTWLQVLESVLAKSNHHAYFLRGNVIWIGPIAARKKAETLLNTALLRAAQIPRLMEQTECEFVDTPWEDTVDFLADLHNVNLVRLWNEGKKTSDVTLKLEIVPVCLALAIIAERANLEWDVVENTIVFIPVEHSQNLKRLEQDFGRLKTLVRRLDLDNQPLGAKLNEMTEVEFVDESLYDALEFLSDLHRLNVILVDEDDAKLPISFVNSGSKLSWTLSMILAEQGMSWGVDEGQILVARRKVLKEYFQSAKGREIRRLNYPKSVTKKLRASFDATLVGDGLGDLTRQLGAKVGIPIELDPSVEKLHNRSLSLQFRNTPVDVALDVLALRFGLDWNITEKGELILQTTPRQQD